MIHQITIVVTKIRNTFVSRTIQRRWAAWRENEGGAVSGHGLDAGRHGPRTMWVQIQVTHTLRTGTLVSRLAFLLQHHPPPFCPGVLEPHLKTRKNGLSYTSLEKIHKTIER